MTSSVSAREWGLWGVWVVPEAGQPVPNMSCSLDSRAVTSITIAEGQVCEAAFLRVGCWGQIGGSWGERGEGDEERTPVG